MKYTGAPSVFLSSAFAFLLAACTPAPPSEPGGAGGSGGKGGSGGRGGTTGGAGGGGTGGTGTGGATGGSGGTAGTGTGGTGTGGTGTGGTGTGGTGGTGTGGSGSPDAGTATETPGGTGGSGGSGGSPIEPPPGPTDLTKHRYSKVVTLNTAGVMSDVAKYPVAIQLNAMNFDFAQAKAAGEDIRFATMQGTLLPYSIELWDANGKQAAIWVKVDLKGNSMNPIAMHWGNPDAVSAGSTKSVFSNEDGFLGVYHLDQDGNNAPDHYKDSSATEAHMTGFNMEPGNSVPGRVGRAIRLDNPGGQGKNQWLGVTGPKVDMPFNASAARPISATAWAWGETFGGYYETIMSKGDTSWTLQRDYMGRMEACTWSGSYHSCAIAPRPPVKRWVHYMVVQTTSQLTLYIDGRRAAGAGSFNRTGTHGFAISHNYQANNNAATGRREWHGMIDEVRVMTGAKSADWAMLDFQSQREGSTFFSFGPTMMK